MTPSDTLHEHSEHSALRVGRERPGNGSRSALERRTLIALGIIAAGSVGLSARFNWAERYLDFAARHERWQLDELLSVAVVAAIALGVLLWMHAGELQRAANERALAVSNLRSSEQRFAHLFSADPSAVLLVSLRSGEIRDANPAFERLTGHRRADVLGKAMDVLGLWAIPEVGTSLHGMLRQSGDLRNIELELHTKDEDVHTVLVSSQPIDVAGDETAMLTLTDITDRKRLEQQLSHQALHDSVTDLANRALFRDRVEHALTRGRRNGMVPAVLFIDLDDFKRINDTLGHACGDALLQATAKRLRTIVRTSDTAARLGGDEFGILLEDAASARAACTIAERVLAVLRPPFQIAGGEVFIAASIGVAMADHAMDEGELQRNADVAMYMAKAAGKGRFALFEPAMQASLNERRLVEEELRHAISGSEFELDFQPIVELASENVVALEALVRWRHPRRGRLGPGSFIPVAEATGLIVEVGEWVLREACRSCLAWDAAAPDRPPLTLNVNLSVRQLRDDSVVDRVAAVLAETGIDARRIVLEITESMLVGNDDEAVERLWGLKQLGLQLAIDDFGTGYASLASLQNVPVDVIKIDKSFTDRLGRLAESPLSRAVVSLGGTLCVRTVAEGIETQAQLDRLRELGCGYGQGFLLARPMPAAEVGAYLTRAGRPAVEPEAGVAA